MASQSGMVDPAIFKDLQARSDEDAAVRDVSTLHEIRSRTRDIILTSNQELKEIIQTLEKQSTLAPHFPRYTN